MSARKHDVTLAMQRRPHLDPLRRAVCPICGPLQEWTDLHDAKIAQRQHLEAVALGRVVGA